MNHERERVIAELQQVAEILRPALGCGSSRKSARRMKHAIREAYHETIDTIAELQLVDALETYRYNLIIEVTDV